MRKTILLTTACLALIATAFIIKPKNDIVGHWAISPGEKGTVLLDFRKDGKVKVDIPGEKFTIMGKYKVKADVISLYDSTCGKNYWGTYTLKFNSENSLYTTVLTDSCMPRSTAMDKATLIRQK